MGYIDCQIPISCNQLSLLVSVANNSDVLYSNLRMMSFICSFLFLFLVPMIVKTFPLESGHSIFLPVNQLNDDFLVSSSVIDSGVPLDPEIFSQTLG